MTTLPITLKIQTFANTPSSLLSEMVTLATSAFMDFKSAKMLYPRRDEPAIRPLYEAWRRHFFVRGLLSPDYWYVNAYDGTTLVGVAWWRRCGVDVGSLPEVKCRDSLLQRTNHSHFPSMTSKRKASAQ